MSRSSGARLRVWALRTINISPLRGEKHQSVGRLVQSFLQFVDALKTLQDEATNLKCVGHPKRRRRCALPAHSIKIICP